MVLFDILQLCPFAEMGVCPFEDNKLVITPHNNNIICINVVHRCEYLHGDICDMCNRQCLNPFDPEQRKGER